MESEEHLRKHIVTAISSGLESLACVLAGWESGSVAFARDDAYSDIDLNFLLDDTVPEDAVHNAVASALATVSPVLATHASPPGRYYKLRDGGDYLLVDVCLYRIEDIAERLDHERHGDVRTFFDKAGYLKPDPEVVTAANLTTRHARFQEHREWFSISQGFVRKAILRGRDIEALAGYWAYTLRPLVELLRMRHCPARWDFGMRYLEQDLPAEVCDALGDLVHVGASGDLDRCLSRASAWAEQLIRELDQPGAN